VYVSRHELFDAKPPILSGKRVGGLYEVKIYRSYFMNQSSFSAADNSPLSLSASVTPVCSCCTLPGLHSLVSVNVENVLLSSGSFANLADVQHDNLFTLWHHRLGHIDHNYLNNMQNKKAVDGMHFFNEIAKVFSL